MIERFEQFTTDIAHIYQNIQRIKEYEMSQLGLKGTHVNCISFLHMNPQGLTAAEICTLSKKDKGGISRTLSELEQMGFICYESSESKGTDKRKYRAKAVLTAKGREYATEVDKRIIHAVSRGGEGITEEERRIFYTVLSTIAQNLEGFCEELDGVPQLPVITKSKQRSSTK